MTETPPVFEPFHRDCHPPNPSQEGGKRRWEKKWAERKKWEREGARQTTAAAFLWIFASLMNRSIYYISFFLLLAFKRDGSKDKNRDGSVFYEITSLLRIVNEPLVNGSCCAI
ncbi:hypothetical protein EUGRSUZ_A00194 [Eucalyptus grandis]|uniref:Uncharacterized protein n=2 Tax=Eucalyptus grandis TaxID=71139 RepID=A0A059DBM2_EUCGR|nr:hypothetical protein EUGRSUZ_A00194 [Eucalyptus grandis]